MVILTPEEYREKRHPNKSIKTVIRRLTDRKIPTNETVIKKGRNYLVVIDDDIRIKRGLPYDVTIKGSK